MGPGGGGALHVTGGSREGSVCGARPSPAPPRMESTEKCEAVITHFNGKYIKTPPGVPGGLGGS